MKFKAKKFQQNKAYHQLDTVHQMVIYQTECKIVSFFPWNAPFKIQLTPENATRGLMQCFTL